MGKTSSLGHKPKGRWAFDAKVTGCFDDMLERSIPQYAEMRKACFEIACPHVQQHTAIVDVGCSRGEALAPFVDEFGAHNRFVGLEISKPMLEAARLRFAGLIAAGVVQVREHDLRAGYPAGLQASVTLCVLTLQFTPIEYRLRIVRDIWRSTIEGGVLILVEKLLGASADLDERMVERYYALKQDHGYTRDDILRKRLALEGVLVPVTAKWNEDLLRLSGFREVDCFWRWMNFAGWIAVKYPAKQVPGSCANTPGLHSNSVWGALPCGRRIRRSGMQRKH
jgi:tRNA (cmo5U34)-methyltransferase